MVHYRKEYLLIHIRGATDFEKWVDGTHEIVDVWPNFVYYDITYADLIKVEHVFITCNFSIALATCLGYVTVNLIGLCLDNDIVHTETLEGL